MEKNNHDAQKNSPRKYKLRRLPRIRSSSENNERDPQLIEESNMAKFISLQLNSEKRLLSHLNEQHSLKKTQEPLSTPKGPKVTQSTIPSILGNVTETEIDFIHTNTIEIENNQHKINFEKSKQKVFFSEKFSSSPSQDELVEQSESEFESFKNVFSIGVHNKTNTKSIAKFEDQFYREERDSETRIVDKFFGMEEKKKSIIVEETELNEEEIFEKFEKKEEEENEKEVDLKKTFQPFRKQKNLATIVKAREESDNRRNSVTTAAKTHNEPSSTKLVRFNKQVLVKKIEGRKLMNFRYGKME